MDITQLSQLGQQQIEQWIASNQFAKRPFSKGSYLLRQGEASPPIYWVDDGLCSIGFTAENGRRFSHGRFHAQQRLFGHIEFLTQTPCQFDVCCDNDFQAICISQQQLADFLQDHAAAAIWLAQCLSSYYQYAMEQVTNQIAYPLVYNIAKDLLQRHLGNKPPLEFSRVYQEAERFGCSERVYRRAVNQLIEQGLVKKDKKQLKIIAPEKINNFLNSLECKP